MSNDGPRRSERVQQREVDEQEELLRYFKQRKVASDRSELSTSLTLSNGEGITVHTSITNVPPLQQGSSFNHISNDLVATSRVPLLPERTPNDATTNTTESTPPPATTTPLPPKRGRGRPKGSLSKKKNKPEDKDKLTEDKCTAAAEATPTDETPAGETPAKRKRGRPKGSLSKKKSKPEDERIIDETATASVTETPEKKKRGSLSGSNTQRKKRGKYKKRSLDNLDECYEKLLISGTVCKKKWADMAKQDYSNSVSGQELYRWWHSKSFEKFVCKKLGSNDAYTDLNKSLDNDLEERYEKLLISGTDRKMKWTVMAEQDYSNSVSGKDLRNWWHSKSFEKFVCKKLRSEDAYVDLNKMLDEEAKKERVLRDEEKQLLKKLQKQLEEKERDRYNKLTCLDGNGELKVTNNHDLNQINRLRKEVLLSMLQTTKGCGTGSKYKLVRARSSDGEDLGTCGVFMVKNARGKESSQQLLHEIHNIDDSEFTGLRDGTSRVVLRGNYEDNYRHVTQHLGPLLKKQLQAAAEGSRFGQTLSLNDLLRLQRYLQMGAKVFHYDPKFKHKLKSDKYSVPPGSFLMFRTLEKPGGGSLKWVRSTDKKEFLIIFEPGDLLIFTAYAGLCNHKCASGKYTIVTDIVLPPDATREMKIGGGVNGKAEAMIMDIIKRQLA